MARVINPKDFIQKCRDNKFYEFKVHDLDEICRDFHQMYDRLQNSKNERFLLFNFNGFIQRLRDKDFVETQNYLEGALQEYELLLALSGKRANLQKRQDVADSDPSEAIHVQNERIHADTNMDDQNKDRKKISLSKSPFSSTFRNESGSVIKTIVERASSNRREMPDKSRNNDHAVRTDGIRELLRRSEEASLLLQQGNPNITDLSDSNRPTNLAEQFSELYSNEYTDAFEFLQTQGQTEEEIVYDLLRIVRHAYKYCRQRASEEMSRRFHSVVQEREVSIKEITAHENEKVILKGLAAKKLKTDALHLKNEVCNTFMEKQYWRLIPKEIDPVNNYLVIYAYNCLEIVWLMCVQDPPISVSWVDKGDRFDTSLYRAYTSSGTKVDFCVWPLVLLADNGPVLLKGIAQGKE